MEVNTINRVVLSGEISGKVKEIPIKLGDKVIKMAIAKLKQADPRKKEVDEKKKANLFVIKAIGEAAESLLGLTPGQNVIVRGMIQARKKKGEEESPGSIITYIFLPDADSIQLATGPNLINEATIVGRIYTAGKIQTKVHDREDGSANVLFTVQVGKAKPNENPFAETEPVNLVFVKYKPKNPEGFRQIKERFYDKGRFVAVTGALISEIKTVEKKQVYRIELITRQLFLFPSASKVKVQPVSVDSIFSS